MDYNDYKYLVKYVEERTEKFKLDQSDYKICLVKCSRSTETELGGRVILKLEFLVKDIKMILKNHGYRLFILKIQFGNEG
ncbi:hypothetical protein CD110_10045 [Staphylococcus casei]|nr:hypothetical protein CD110_10045 [Staphylococcus casei]